MYIGNYKKSAIHIHIYDKRYQSAAHKRTHLALHTRVEPRQFPKNFEDLPEESLVEPKNEKPINAAKKKIYQRLAQADVKYSLSYYVKIFENYKSPCQKSKN